MQDVNQRGCVYLIGALIFAAIFCFFIPFVLLPSWGTAVTLPVITVPAEYYREDWPSASFELVNSLGGALLANIIVLWIAFAVRGASNNWTKEVPGRLQGAVEVITEGLWGLTKDQAGSKPKIKNILFPIVASLFLFLLAANWGKLLPGVETVGVLHCAVYEPVAFNGHPVIEQSFLGMPYYVLRVEGPLQTGTPGTEKSYKQCEALMEEGHYAEYLPRYLDPWLDDGVVHVVGQAGDGSDLRTLAEITAFYQAQAAEVMESDLPEGDQYRFYIDWRDPEISLESVLGYNTDESGEVTVAFANVAEGDDHATEGVPAIAEQPLELGTSVVVRPELFGEKATTRNNQIFTVAPFVRGAATDLSFTLGLAIMSFLLIQAFGVSELGLGYFQKFINVRAIGNIQNRPLGLIDFVVGLFEIISEFGKIISLAFRLFGALFAGTLLYAVIMFLTGTTTPVLILGLEIIVGAAQAGVFAILTLIFCAQAMVSHHHDDHDHDHEHDGDHEHAPAH